jgi:hypothetical protein
MEERRQIFGLHRQQETDHRGARPFESRETLKKDVARGGYHTERNADETVKKPKQLYEDEGEDRSSYKDFSLDVFRNHIYQEEALIKHLNLNSKGGGLGKSKKKRK